MEFKGYLRQDSLVTDETMAGYLELARHYLWLEEVRPKQEKVYFTEYDVLATLHFQRRHDLQPDGILGPLTYQALKETKPLPRRQKERVIFSLLPVPYYSQRDNEYKPWGTCNVTALAMLLAYANPDLETEGQGQLEDRLYKEITSEEAMKYYRERFSWAAQKGLNPNTVHGMLDWLAARYGVYLDFGFFSMKRIRKALKTYPVILAGNFTGSGHIVLAVGCSTDFDLIVHDPFGDWNRGYRGEYGSFGVRRVYSFETVWNVLHRHENGFMGHIVKHVENAYF